MLHVVRFSLASKPRTRVGEAICHLCQKSPVQELRVRRRKSCHAFPHTLRGVQAFQRLVHAAVSFADEGRHAEASIARLGGKGVQQGSRVVWGGKGLRRRLILYVHAFVFVSALPEMTYRSWQLPESTPCCIKAVTTLTRTASHHIKAQLCKILRFNIFSTCVEAHWLRLHPTWPRLHRIYLCNVSTRHFE